MFKVNQLVSLKARWKPGLLGAESLVLTDVFFCLCEWGGNWLVPGSSQAGKNHAAVCPQVGFQQEWSVLSLLPFSSVLLASGAYNLGDTGLSESLASSTEHGTPSMLNDVFAERMVGEGENAHMVS